MQIEGILFIRKDSTYQTKDTDDVLWIKLDKMEELLGLPVPELQDGIEYATTNNKDEKKRQEQEDRRKLRAQREAAKEDQKATTVGEVSAAEAVPAEENGRKEVEAF